ncbi:MAG: MFS transporter [Armatimonadota bacterium]
MAAAAPREKIGTVMGAFQTSWSLGFVVGPITGAFLSGLVGYRGTFLAQAAFAALGGAVILVWVRENHRPERDPSRRGLVRTLTADLRPLASSRPVLVLWTAMFTMMFGFALVFPLFTLYVQELGIPKDRVAIMSGMMMFIVGGIQSVLAPLFGRLGDRLGHKGVMVVGAYAVGAFIAPQAFVADFWQFLTLRLFSTAAGAAMMPTSNALLASLMPARQYGGAYGVLGSSRTLAVAIGPLVGGVVAAHFGIRATFLLCAAFSFASAVWAHYGIRPPPQAIPAPSSRPE